jgi:hypothetical protein
MEINGPKTPFAVRLFETLQMSSKFTCSCCGTVMDTRPHAAYVAAYKPRDQVMKKAVPLETGAAYVVCQECSRLPEREVFLRCQEHLVKNGLLQKNHKPLDVPGRHSPGKRKKPMISQGSEFKFRFN